MIFSRMQENETDMADSLQFRVAVCVAGRVHWALEYEYKYMVTRCMHMCSKVKQTWPTRYKLVLQCLLIWALEFSCIVTTMDI